MRDILFLFGAGASHGAGDILPEAPPLGSQLYSELASIYPLSWGNLPPEIKSRFESENFESGMGLLYDKYSQVVAELMAQMAVYIIQFRPHTSNSLYCRLVRYLRDTDLMNRVAFSTLNYDCILEFSLLQHGFPIAYFDQGNLGTVPVWKLHGSCNMFSKDVKASGILYSKGVVFEGGLEAVLDIGTVVEKCLVNQALSPAMCLYMRGKPLQISPSAITKVQELWRDHLASAEKVFCIGVNPWPDDNHIWDFLSTTPAKFFFIGDLNAFTSWASAHRSGPSDFISSTYHNGFESLERALST